MNVVDQQEAFEHVISFESFVPGPKRTVILNSLRVIQEALINKKDAFSGRPMFYRSMNNSTHVLWAFIKIAKSKVV